MYSCRTSMSLTVRGILRPSFCCRKNPCKPWGCGSVKVSHSPHPTPPRGACTMNATSNAIILAIDLGKYKSVACILEQDSGEFRFASFETTRAELRKLIVQQQPGVIVIEACLLAGWVHDLCSELGLRCLVANTASEAWKFKHLKRKTDKDDALRLAQLH